MKNNIELTIIIPCRNEEQFIAKCLDSILRNNYPKHRIEIIVIDGKSTDNTLKILKDYKKRCNFIKIITNKKEITPISLNMGIKKANGEIIMRIDAHSTLDKGYIKNCLQSLKEYKADDVGGIWKIYPRKNNLIEKSVALAMQSPFGAGSAYYRTGTTKPKFVDAVPWFCCKKSLFKEVGLFNENLIRSQDMEFNKRILAKGKHILLNPKIISNYYVRSDLPSFTKHNFKNGIWAILPFKFSRHIPVSIRHLIPLFFVSFLIFIPLLSLKYPLLINLLTPIIISYLLLNVYYSTKISLKEKNWLYLITTLLIFALLHLSYGLGSLYGIIKYPFYGYNDKK